LPVLARYQCSRPWGSAILRCDNNGNLARLVNGTLDFEQGDLSIKKAAHYLANDTQPMRKQETKFRNNAESLGAQMAVETSAESEVDIG